MANESAMTEMSSYLEGQKETLEQERLEEANRSAEIEVTDWHFGERLRSEELGELAHTLAKVSGSKPSAWGYHHYF